MKKGNNERRIEIKKGRKQMKEINERKKRRKEINEGS